MAFNSLRSGKTGRALITRWYALWPITVGLILYPINNLAVRLGIITGIAVLWTGLFYFYGNLRFLRIAAFLCISVTAAFFLLPGKAYDATTLRQQYLTALLRYQGTRYIWGGENWLGIDCSGLVRSGLITANYQRGFLTLNSRLVREGFSLWWHDCSARALGEEYRGRTQLLISFRSINEIDYEKILPGDIAVLEDGVHTMAYLGDRRWIEADPEAHKVITIQAPSTNAWFVEPVKVMRWTELQEQP